MDEGSTGDGKRKRKANRDHKVKGEKNGTEIHQEQIYTETQHSREKTDRTPGKQ